jgi:hypothetical protein
MRITRRGLIAGTVAAAALGTGVAALSLPLLRAPRRWLVWRVVQDHVPGIVFEGEDLARFTEEVDRLVLGGRIGWRGTLRYGGAVLLRDWPGAGDLFAPVGTRQDLDQRIVNAFFRATDFFDGPYTPGRRIATIRSPDPYVSRCSNPLAVIAAS